MATDKAPVSDRLPPRATPSLATRIASWTSKGIATAVILVAGLAFGRQVLQWWHEDDQSAGPSAASTAPLAGLGDETAEHELRFGNQPWAVRRQLFEGDLKSAVAVLREKCRRATAAGLLPDAPPGPQEQSLLKSLADQTPVAEEKDAWAVYQLDEAVPMVVGVRPAAQKPGPPAGRDVAGTDLRVVSWGFGVPAATGGWTLYTFVAVPPNLAASTTDLQIPLPSDCTRTMSVRVSGGGGIVVFRGPRQVETWKACYDQYFHERGWTAPQPWQTQGDRWSRCYQGGPHVGSVDIQFGPDPRGGMTALITITPHPAEPAGSESL